VEHRIRTLTLVALVGLLAAILAFLVVLSLNGIHIEYTGDMRVAGIPSEIELRLAQPVTLTLADGSTLTAAVSGAQTQPVAIAFANALCPTCGSSMLPVRINILTGKIDWACPQCGSTAP
jgi:hypothetical protein